MKLFILLKEGLFSWIRMACSSRIIVFIILILFSFACKIDSDSGVSFGKGGNIDRIIIPPNAEQPIRFAADELQYYLKEMTGMQIQIIESGNDRANAINFYLDENPELNWDGFSIATENKGLSLRAKEPRGLLYSVYQLLEEAGCSFVYLGRQEEIVPHSATINFLHGKRIFNPVIEHRGLAPYGLQASSVELGRDFISWMAKNKLNYILISEDRPSDSPGSAHGSIWKEVSDELLPELQKRGFIIEMSEHCTQVFFPRSLFASHPDWFALNDGERKLGDPPYSGQMCYSNQEAVEYYATAVADYAAKHPEFHVIGTWPLDGGEYCECDNCRDLQTVFKAAKYVAEKVKKVRPDMIVEHLAYKTQTWFPPESAKLPNNISVLWCPDNGKMDSLASEWIQKSTQAGGTYQFEYLMGDNYRGRTNIWLRPELASNIVDHAQEIGFKGIISLFLPMENWWRSCFNYWFFAKACWNPDLDKMTYLHMYCQNYYGIHATEIEKIFQSIFDELQSEQLTSESGQSDEYRPQATQRIAAKIVEQLEMIIHGSKDPVIIERLMRLKVYVAYFQLYYKTLTINREQLERLMDFSKNHPDYNMVLMPPDYIQWRLMDYVND